MTDKIAISQEGRGCMNRTVGIGIQSFEKIREGNYFYIDKTRLVKEWWESGDDVTLITRPRRFGKSLNINMLNSYSPWIIRIEETYFKGLPFGKKRSIGSCREPIL